MNRLRMIAAGAALTMLVATGCNDQQSSQPCPVAAYEAYSAGELTFDEYQQAVLDCEQERPQRRGLR